MWRRKIIRKGRSGEIVKEKEKEQKSRRKKRRWRDYRGWSEASSRRPAPETVVRAGFELTTLRTKGLYSTNDLPPLTYM